jgi:hypothetical protein
MKYDDMEPLSTAEKIELGAYMLGILACGVGLAALAFNYFW